MASDLDGQVDWPTSPGWWWSDILNDHDFPEHGHRLFAFAGYMDGSGSVLQEEYDEFLDQREFTARYGPAKFLPLLETNPYDSTEI